MNRKDEIKRLLEEQRKKVDYMGLVYDLSTQEGIDSLRLAIVNHRHD